MRHLFAAGIFQRRIFTALSWLKNIRKDQDEEEKQKIQKTGEGKWAYLILAALIVFAMPLADKTLQHYIEVVIDGQKMASIGSLIRNQRQKQNQRA